MTSGALGGRAQVRALVTLRWRMVRSPASRGGLLLLAGLVPLAIAVGIASAARLPPDLRFDALVLAPTVYLGFAVLAIIAPLAAGGGSDLFPPDQLVAYPVSPSAQFLTGLAVAPLNLAWVSQLVALTTTTSFFVGLGLALPLALITLLVYVGLVTVGGQVIAWLVVGVRQSRRGRHLLNSGLALLAAAIGVVVNRRLVAEVLDRAPTRAVVRTEADAAAGNYGPWLWKTVLMAALMVGLAAAGVRACDWATRRPGDAGASRDARRVSRRRLPTKPMRALLAVDRASVWRSVSLRRGALVLALVPAAVAVVAQVTWPALVILPGVVASGAGLLYGVNLFCLDASGGVWLASLPHPPGLVARAKTRVLAETCLATVSVALVAGMLRTDRAPTRSEAAALLCSVVAATATVVAICLRTSLRRPHRADLRGPRDAPAPPGAMAVYSVGLATRTTLLGLLLAGTAQQPVWWLAPLVATPVVCWAAASVLRSWRGWEDPTRRAAVVLTVATG